MLYHYVSLYIYTYIHYTEICIYIYIYIHIGYACIYIYIYICLCYIDIQWFRCHLTPFFLFVSWSPCPCLSARRSGPSVDPCCAWPSWRTRILRPGAGTIKIGTWLIKNRCVYIYIYMWCITDITLHCITLHYITVHYITYIYHDDEDDDEDEDYDVCMYCIV